MQLTARSIQVRKSGYALAWVMVALFALIFLTITGIISLSWFFSYEEILAWKDARTALFRYSFERYNRIFTMERYLYSRYLAVALWLIGIWLIWVAMRYRKYYISFFSQLYIFITDQIRYSRQAYLKMSKNEKAAFFVVFALSWAIHIYHLSYLPAQIDELMTYFYFVKEGFLLTSVFYPFPNNHVFFNWVYLFFNNFIGDPILAGRLPSLLSFHLMLLILFFGLVRYLKDYKVAWFSVFVCTLFFTSGIYAAEARGYAILSLLTFIACFALLIGIEQHRKETFFIFTLVSIAAAFTVPIYLIPYLSLVAYGIAQSVRQKDKPLFRQMIMSSLFVGIGVLFCYLPVFLFSGIDAVIANETVVPITASNFLTYIYPIASAELLSYLATIPTKGWAVFMVFGVLGLMMYKNVSERHKRWMVLSLCFFLMIFIYALVFKSFMFQRTLTYATYFIYSSFVIILIFWIKRLFTDKRLRYGAYALWICIIFLLSYFQYQGNRYEISLLPNPFYQEIQRYYSKAIRTDASVYQGVEPGYAHVLLYYQYLAEKYNVTAHQVFDYKDADMLFLQADIISDKAYELENHILVDTIHSDIYFLAPLVVYEKKDK